VTFGPFPARVDDVHDGDTVYLSIDLGFDHLIASHDLDGHPRLACRVYGINAPELSTDPGKAALAYAKTLLPAGARVQVVSHGWDKFGGRFDGAITLPDGRDFAQLMIASGNAVVWDGTGVKPVPPAA
jgi:endonuclease YncB( thermonuclease family)